MLGTSQQTTQLEFFSYSKKNYQEGKGSFINLLPTNKHLPSIVTHVMLAIPHCPGTFFRHSRCTQVTRYTLHVHRRIRFKYQIIPNTLFPCRCLGPGQELGSKCSREQMKVQVFTFGCKTIHKSFVTKKCKSLYICILGFLFAFTVKLYYL